MKRKIRNTKLLNILIYEKYTFHSKSINLNPKRSKRNNINPVRPCVAYTCTCNNVQRLRSLCFCCINHSGKFSQIGCGEVNLPRSEFDFKGSIFAGIILYDCINFEICRVAVMIHFCIICLRINAKLVCGKRLKKKASEFQVGK